MTYRLRTTLRHLVLLPSIALGASSAALAAGSLGPPPSGQEVAAAPGRLIVKYAPSVNRCVGQILDARGRFEDMTGSASLDHLNARLGVRSARPLASARERLGAACAAKPYFDRLAAVRRRFPARAARASHAVRAPDLSSLYVVDINPAIDVHQAAVLYADDPAVVYAEPDYEVRVNFVPDDPYFSTTGTWGQAYEDLWGLHTTRAAEAWDVATGQGVVVAIVDTGIDRTHQDLSDNLWTNAGEIAGNGVDDDANGFTDDIFGWDFDGNDNDPTDKHGHGTHVAGTVAAVGDNGLGVVGMSWGAQVMAVQGLGADGYGWTSDLIEAILYAAENGADVINNSWGGPGTSSSMADAVATARALGAVVVAAAGNSGGNADFYSPAGEEGVITVAASDSDDVIASFSSSGNSVNVAAPGVDVLSLRGKNSLNVGGEVVGTSYLRLSGTSMASPHVAGLAAVLLSALPSLSVDEIQWHIELNSDQPGYPGYEGQAWNPYFGWGRINAANVFNTPPVTTRIGGSLRQHHVFADVPVPNTDLLDLVFTTHDPVAWTLTSPPWAQALPAAGTTSTAIEFSYDATGLSLGHHEGAVIVDAPSSTDGGAASQASLYVHRDERIGSEIVLNANNLSTPSLSGGPVVASNGLGSIVVWGERAPGPVTIHSLKAMYFDAVGNAGPAIVVHEGRASVPYPRIATDGRNYTVVWNQHLCHDSFCFGWGDEAILLKRLDPQGRVLDPEPIVIYRRRRKPSTGYNADAIAFDGEAYTLLLDRSRLSPARRKYYVLRIGSDGALARKKHKIYVSERGSSPDLKLACNNGSCLLVWALITGTTPGGFYVRTVHSLQLIGDQLVSSSPTLSASPFSGVDNIVPDGTNYLVIGTQRKICTSGSDEVICRYDVVGARLAPDGSPVDQQPFVLNQGSPLDTDIRRDVIGAAFDGTNYIVPFGAIDYGGTRAATNTFVARVDTAGNVIDTEDEGLLAFAHGTFGDNRPMVAVNAQSALVIWREEQVFGDIGSYAHVAVPMLARSPSLDFVPSEIGSTGPLSVQEGEILRLALRATGLDPANTTFSGSNLPEGASLDVSTGLFQWKPNGADAGTYAAVRFEATDGATVVSEDLDITVTEGSLSLRGVATFGADGSPAAGMALRLSGLPRQPRVVYTDTDGRYHFEGLLPDRRYRVRLDRPSRREYLADPRTISVVVGTADESGLDLTIYPK